MSISRGVLCEMLVGLHFDGLVWVSAHGHEIRHTLLHNTRKIYLTSSIYIANGREEGIGEGLEGGGGRWREMKMIGVSWEG